MPTDDLTPLAREMLEVLFPDVGAPSQKVETKQLHRRWPNVSPVEVRASWAELRASRWLAEDSLLSVDHPKNRWWGTRAAV